MHIHEIIGLYRPALYTHIKQRVNESNSMFIMILIELLLLANPVYHLGIGRHRIRRHGTESVRVESAT